MEKVGKFMAVVAASGLLFGSYALTGTATTPVPDVTTVCTDTITGTVASLVVPAGAKCKATGLTVTGKTTVYGTLAAFGAAFNNDVNVMGGTISLMNGNGAWYPAIKGNLTIDGSAGENGIYCPNTLNLITGNVVYQNSTGGRLYICTASIGGSLVMENNASGWDIGYLNIGKNLQCDNNTGRMKHTAIFTANNKTGQCAAY